MRIFFLPSKAIAKLHELPVGSGVYYVTAFWRLFYVGKARNLRRRWQKNHQRYNQFKILSPFGRLHFKVMPAHKIDDFEKKEIQRLNPPWNYSPVPGFYGLIRYFFVVWTSVLLYLILLGLLVALVAYLVGYTRSSEGRRVLEMVTNFLSQMPLHRE
jgi:Flp pilus assembly protein TadB